MNTQDIQTIIESAIRTDFVAIESDDNVHFYATVVSPDFEGLIKMKQHKLVMDLFHDAIAAETIHALSLKTYTPEKWAVLQGEK